MSVVEGHVQPLAFNSADDQRLQRDTLPLVSARRGNLLQTIVEAFEVVAQLRSASHSMRSAHVSNHLLEIVSRDLHTQA